jgi:hypothetical protein
MGEELKPKNQKIMLGESEAVERDRAIIDFTIDWLRCILDRM